MQGGGESVRGGASLASGQDFHAGLRDFSGRVSGDIDF